MRELDRCIKCGSCMRACPVVRTFGEGIFPGPRSLAIDEARYASKMSGDELLRCSMCLSCREACPSKIDLPRSLLELRGPNIRVLRPGHSKMVKNIDAYGWSITPIGDPPSFVHDNDADTCLFPGCISTWRSPKTVKDALELLNMNGPKANIPEGLLCCGSPLEKIGDKERLDRLVVANTAILERFERIVTTCPGCAGQLSERYGLDTLHMVEHLFEVVGVDRLSKSLDGRGKKVAVHMPCHLGRGLGRHTVEYLHAILEAIPGLKVIDHPYEDDCCGAGGGLLSGFPELAEGLARRKVDRLCATGADIAVTACPFCVLNLNTSKKVEVVDLASLLVRMMRR